MRFSARQGEAMSPLPGANSPVGRVGSRSQVQQLDSATLVRFRSLLNYPDAVVRSQFTRIHWRYGVHLFAHRDRVFDVQIAGPLALATVTLTVALGVSGRTFFAMFGDVIHVGGEIELATAACVRAGVD